jgi:WhiB family redox-sensing transcriptional regulator
MDLGWTMTRARVDTPDRAWMIWASCRGRHDLGWFLDRPRSKKDKDAVATALAMCHRCPVRTACLMHALNNDELHGIWGGMTAEQRAGIGRVCDTCGRRLGRHVRPTRTRCIICELNPATP